MQNKFGHVEIISYLCSIKKNKEKQQFKTAVDRINTDTETMKLQNINTGKIDDLQNCQYYNESQVIYKINLRPWVMPGEKFFASHESVTPKVGEGSNFTTEGWTILDIAPGWEIVKGKKAGQQPAAAGTPKEEEKKQPESAPAEPVQPQPQPQQETKPTTAQEQQPAQIKMQQSKTKIVDVVLSVSYDGTIEKEDFANFAAKVLNGCLSLEKKGCRVNLYLFLGSSVYKNKKTYDKQNIISIIKVKDSKIALDPLSVAYPVINSSFLRRHIFRLMEITPGLSRKFVGTYGSPIRDTKNYLPGQLKNALTFEYYNRADIEKTFTGV